MRSVASFIGRLKVQRYLTAAGLNLKEKRRSSDGVLYNGETGIVADSIPKKAYNVITQTIGKTSKSL